MSLHGVKSIYNRMHCTHKLAFRRCLEQVSCTEMLAKIVKQSGKQKMLHCS